MTTATMTASESADGLRAYIRTLRQGRNISQKKLAKEIGLSERAYIDYETGKTEELKSAPLLRAFQVLGVAWEDIWQLPYAAAAHGEALAKRRLSLHLTPEQERLLDDLAQSAPDQDIDRIIAIFTSLRADSRALGRWMGFGESLADLAPDKSEQAPGQ